MATGDKKSSCTVTCTVCKGTGTVQVYDGRVHTAQCDVCPAGERYIKELNRRANTPDLGLVFTLPKYSDFPKS